MHELGLARQVVSVVSAKAGPGRVTRVVLEVGRNALVLPDAMQLAFEVCARGTPAAGAVLEIVEIPAVARCRACDAELDLDQPFGECGCGSSDLRWVSGDELRILRMEVA